MLKERHIYSIEFLLSLKDSPLSMTPCPTIPTELLSTVLDNKEKHIQKKSTYGSRKQHHASNFQQNQQRFPPSGYHHDESIDNEDNSFIPHKKTVLWDSLPSKSEPLSANEKSRKELFDEYRRQNLAAMMQESNINTELMNQQQQRQQRAVNLVDADRSLETTTVDSPSKDEEDNHEDSFEFIEDHSTTTSNMSLSSEINARPYSSTILTKSSDVGGRVAISSIDTIVDIEENNSSLGLGFFDTFSSSSSSKSFPTAKFSRFFSKSPSYHGYQPDDRQKSSKGSFTTGSKWPQEQVSRNKITEEELMKDLLKQESMIDNVDEPSSKFHSVVDVEDRLTSQLSSSFTTNKSSVGKFDEESVLSELLSSLQGPTRATTTTTTTTASLQRLDKAVLDASILEAELLKSNTTNSHTGVGEDPSRDENLVTEEELIAQLKQAKQQYSTAEVTGNYKKVEQEKKKSTFSNKPKVNSSSLVTAEQPVSYASVVAHNIDKNTPGQMTTSVEGHNSSKYQMKSKHVGKGKSQIQQGIESNQLMTSSLSSSSSKPMKVQTLYEIEKELLGLATSSVASSSLVGKKQH